MNLPKISVIISVYNGAKFLEKTIQSVINQTYLNKELIVIDGGSTDGSIDIIKKYEDKIAYWVSESDKGISDAFNKGVKKASGEFINFQGDGDGFLEKESLTRLFESVDCKKCKFVSARIARVDKKNQLEFNSPYLGNFNKKSLLFRMSMPHQGLFTHKSYFEKYGLFDVNNTFCMDYEHLLRSYKDFPSVCTSDLIVARWRNDGLGNGREREILAEYHKIKVKNNIQPYFILMLLNFWTLLKYNLKLLLGKSS